MSNVAVQKIEDQKEKTMPVLAKIAERIEDVRRRAFELFEKRDRQHGHDLEDWLTAEREVFGWPAAEMAERDTEYELQMTLPGFDAKDVQVTVTPSEIIVHAETESEKGTERANVLWTEFASNDIYRRFEMPQPIEVDKTKATLDQGVLRITALKAAAKEKAATVTA